MTMMGRKGRSRQDLEQISVTFQDVAVYFTEVEWKLLQPWQKELFKATILEIHQVLLSLGYHIVNTTSLLRIKKGDNMCMLDVQDQEESAELNNPSLSSYPDIYPDIFLRIKQEDEPYSSYHSCYGETDTKKRFGKEIASRDEDELTENLMHHGNGDLLERSFSPSSVISFIVKEEEGTCAPVHQDAHQMENTEFFPAWLLPPEMLPDPAKETSGGLFKSTSAGEATERMNKSSKRNTFAVKINSASKLENKKHMGHTQAILKGAKRKSPLQYITSQKGRPQLLHEGYIYCNEKINNERTMWKCNKYSSLKCRGRAVTFDNELVHITGHNHPPVATDNEIRKK